MATQAARILTSNSKKKETELEPSVRGNLGKFFTLTLDMFFIAGFDGYFKQLNPMCEKTLGYTTKDF
jgi:hypothetical protein